MSKRKDVDSMTDREILELLLEKVSNIEGDVTKLKRQVTKSTAELKAMDELIFDEVERVHAILDRHKEDKSVHIV